jgi:hypothetical protein
MKMNYAFAAVTTYPAAAATGSTAAAAAAGIWLSWNSR